MVVNAGHAPAPRALISDHHDRCAEPFDSLLASASNAVRDFGDQASIGKLSNEFDRYKVWAGNVGARLSFPGLSIE